MLSLSRQPLNAELKILMQTLNSKNKMTGVVMSFFSSETVYSAG